MIKVLPSAMTQSNILVNEHNLVFVWVINKDGGWRQVTFKKSRLCS